MKKFGSEKASIYDTHYVSRIIREFRGSESERARQHISALDASQTRIGRSGVRGDDAKSDPDKGTR